jgi:hypothetical protein
MLCLAYSETASSVRLIVSQLASRRSTAALSLRPRFTSPSTTLRRALSHTLQPRRKPMNKPVNPPIPPVDWDAAMTRSGCLSLDVAEAFWKERAKRMGYTTPEQFEKMKRGALPTLPGHHYTADPEPITLKLGLLSRELRAFDTSNVPCSKLRNGTLEVLSKPAGDANAELGRIGSGARLTV